METGLGLKAFLFGKKEEIAPIVRRQRSLQIRFRDRPPLKIENGKAEITRVGLRVDVVDEQETVYLFPLDSWLEIKSWDI